MSTEIMSLYRMTHIENIPHILTHGITHRTSHNSNPNFISIGDVSLIDTRSRKIISVDNGDLFNPNAKVITLGDYIPFYFGVKMPMLYVMQHGGNFVERATPPQNIVYIVCRIKNIVNAGMTFYFSDGHGTDSLTSFYDTTHINNLANIVDIKAIKTSYWGGPENLDLRRKKQAEFLISGDIPPNFISGYGCYNEESKQRLIAMGIADEKIQIVPQAYY
ncbi:DUF4433 domain-containing protein [Elizabethkingia anophelis]|nr:DUF4433 domain-containing protein [Elizabethkingia anophelis]MCT3631285.1 DUF4433 domain-containing protein [Elizabethkingia anophelis]MCT3634924.1 DUF4433 domain-containing protein [Elizabethkingia anophelis]MCT3689988.1 DUF4433 domain-containing protein [Elizabethkingia anophelis]MCT3821456.1 DUF4433 domain-containing protein [Elizabethkingia anophelis]MCT3831526.1 DUF4433 domain-containing protein [Elizabethkingia anophelis]